MTDTPAVVSLTPTPPPAATDVGTPGLPPAPTADEAPPAEIGGPTGPEPTRFGDWERNGRCSDF